MADPKEDLDEKGAPIALLLMKFEGAPGRDKTYTAIASVLSEAGFQPLRADQIRASGPVVDEVCHLIETAELVVADSSRGARPGIAAELRRR